MTHEREDLSINATITAAQVIFYSFFLAAFQNERSSIPEELIRLCESLDTGVLHIKASLCGDEQRLPPVPQTVPIVEPLL